MALFDFLLAAPAAKAAIRDAGPTSDASGLRSLFGAVGRGGDRVMQEGQTAADILKYMSGEEKRQLFGGLIDQNIGTLEGTMEANPLVASRVYDILASQMPAQEASRSASQVMPAGNVAPRTPVDVTELPPPPTEADILAADIAGGGMMMAEPDPRSLARAENIYPKTLPNEEARIRGMSDFLNKEGGAYGGAGAIAAASGIDTGFTGRELSGRRGAAASDFEQEQKAFEIGSLVIPGKIGVEAAMIAARTAGPRTLRLVTNLLREKGLLGPSNAVKKARQFGSTDQYRQTLARQGTEYDPKMYGPGSPTAMSSGGSIQRSILDRYNRMY